MGENDLIITEEAEGIKSIAGVEGVEGLKVCVWRSGIRVVQKMQGKEGALRGTVGEGVGESRRNGRLTMSPFRDRALRSHVSLLFISNCWLQTNGSNVPRLRRY